MTEFVDVALTDDVRLPYLAGAESVLAAVAGSFADDWEALAAAFAGLTLTPLFDTTPVEDIAAMADAAREHSGRELSGPVRLVRDPARVRHAGGRRRSGCPGSCRTRRCPNERLSDRAPRRPRGSGRHDNQLYTIANHAGRRRRGAFLTLHVSPQAVSETKVEGASIQGGLQGLVSTITYPLEPGTEIPLDVPGFLLVLAALAIPAADTTRDRAARWVAAAPEAAVDRRRAGATGRPGGRDRVVGVLGPVSER